MDFVSFAFGFVLAVSLDSILFSQRFNPLWRRIREKNNQDSK